MSSFVGSKHVETVPSPFFLEIFVEHAQLRCKELATDTGQRHLVARLYFKNVFLFELVFALLNKSERSGNQIMECCLRRI